MQIRRDGKGKTGKIQIVILRLTPGFSAIGCPQYTDGGFTLFQADYRYQTPFTGEAYCCTLNFPGKNCLEGLVLRIRN